MPTNHRAALANIKRFDQLIAYLRDEMAWPIEGDDFDEMTFEYTAEELGIDVRNTAKIQEIKRLRPLASNQPWGIFFVKFEPKQLPVVALRRILGQVVVKKRASANSSERQAWAAEDLLFVSNYGEGDTRQISFAHFATPNDGRDLPTLKVLGWDNRDTALHLDAVTRELTEHLAWPDDEDNADAWREQWRSAFTLRHREVVTTSRDLSMRLAGLARAIRDRIQTSLAIETQNGRITKLMKAFQEALVHDLDADAFADMYAQTIAYGLLSARIADPRKKTADDFAGHMRTNPFLRDLMETFLQVGGRRAKATGEGIDFDELGVSEVVELLDNANMEAVIRDFGDRNPREDPVTHFYELFLKEYDAEKRMQRGVFYTPRPVVSYIVRSVDELLRTEFGLADGLADITTWGEMVQRCKNLKIPDGVSPDQDFVQILDPATGTGTFLVEAIDVIHGTLLKKWRAQGCRDSEMEALWNEYVPRHLLPRLHGYELLMAPYTIAHLKIGLKLYETGYRFGSGERARIFLTNALEPASITQMTLDFLPALAHEAEAVNEIKRKRRFTVVIGNPPYSGLSSNIGPWIDGLLKGRLPDGTATASYYHVDGEPLGERKVWLQDDYVKFMRLSQWLLDGTGVGVHGYISNHGYLDNPTFRGMRFCLMRAFDRIDVLDLHGNLKKREVAPDGGRDVNVFDIQQGVAIGLFAKLVDPDAVIDLCPVRHVDAYGDRQTKYARLLAETAGSTAWKELNATEPFYLFTPFDSSEVGDYYKWKRINEVMPVSVTGIVTARDHFVIDFERAPLLERMAVLRDGSVPDDIIRRKYFSGKGSKKYLLGDSRGWKLSEARRRIQSDAEWDRRCTTIYYRPFDARQIYYVPWMVDWPRTEAMPHMLAGQNLALITSRMTKGEVFRHAQVTRNIAEVICMSPKTSNNGFVFPIYLYPGVGKADQRMLNPWVPGKRGRRPNLDPAFVLLLEQSTSLTFVSDQRSGREESFGPECVLGYIYAVLNSPEYRRRFKPMLRIDFPRIPGPASRDLFQDISHRGRELVALHLLESSTLDKPITNLTGPVNNEVEKVSYSDETVWLDKAQTYGFNGVPEEVWNFHIGGYQVCHKWLKDRKGRTLSDDHVAHYQKIVVALNETIRIMVEIDEVIEAHGGWPDAFQTGEAPNPATMSTGKRSAST